MSHLQKTFDRYNHQDWQAEPVSSFINGTRMDLVVLVEDQVGRKGYWLAKLHEVEGRMQWVPYYGPAYQMEHGHIIKRGAGKTTQRKAA
tara:strand:- start:2611 stop:2877 length:267 start_codon:yes stop_codon:yes gene_type:complete